MTMLDCPAGTGRLWPTLLTRADSLIAVDSSPGMIRHCNQRAERTGASVNVRQGDAENLPLEDDAVDWTFSYALTKHVPPDVQARMLGEFARASREGVICSFSVFDHVTYELWRRRGEPRAFAVAPEQVHWMARGHGLTVERRERCTTPLGTDFAYLLRRVGRS